MEEAFNLDDQGLRYRTRFSSSASTITCHFVALPSPMILLNDEPRWALSATMVIGTLELSPFGTVLENTASRLRMRVPITSLDYVHALKQIWITRHNFQEGTECVLLMSDIILPGNECHISCRPLSASEHDLQLSPLQAAAALQPTRSIPFMDPSRVGGLREFVPRAVMKAPGEAIIYWPRAYIDGTAKTVHASVSQMSRSSANDEQSITAKAGHALETRSDTPDTIISTEHYSAEEDNKHYFAFNKTREEAGSNEKGNNYNAYAVGYDGTSTLGARETFYEPIRDHESTVTSTSQTSTVSNDIGGEQESSIKEDDKHQNAWKRQHKKKKSQEQCHSDAAQESPVIDRTDEASWPTIASAAKCIVKSPRPGTSSSSSSSSSPTAAFLAAAAAGRYKEKKNSNQSSSSGGGGGTMRSHTYASMLTASRTIMTPFASGVHVSAPSTSPLTTGSSQHGDGGRGGGSYHAGGAGGAGGTGAGGRVRRVRSENPSLHPLLSPPMAGRAASPASSRCTRWSAARSTTTTTTTAEQREEDAWPTTGWPPLSPVAGDGDEGSNGGRLGEEKEIRGNETGRGKQEAPKPNSWADLLRHR